MTFFRFVRSSDMLFLCFLLIFFEFSFSKLFYYLELLFFMAVLQSILKSITFSSQKDNPSLKEMKQHY